MQLRLIHLQVYNRSEKCKVWLVLGVYGSKICLVSKLYVVVVFLAYHAVFPMF